LVARDDGFCGEKLTLRGQQVEIETSRSAYEFYTDLLNMGFDFDDDAAEENVMKNGHSSSLAVLYNAPRPPSVGVEPSGTV